MVAPNVTDFFDEATFTVTYVVADPASKHCAVIDPVLDYDAAAGRTSTASVDAAIEYIRNESLTLDWILETHVHADHLTAAPVLREQLGGKIAIGAHTTDVQRVFKKVFNLKDINAVGGQVDHWFCDGDAIQVGELTGIAMHTPGHTPACMTYVFGDAVFVGDTLFMPDYGTARCDFPGGDAAILFDSIQKIFELPPETRLFMCHDYKAPGRDEFAWETTVAEQRDNNVHLQAGTTKKEFVAFRNGRDETLGVPKLILPSLQVNLRAGDAPPPEDNGVSYLKIPLNQF